MSFPKALVSVLVAVVILAGVAALALGGSREPSGQQADDPSPPVEEGPATTQPLPTVNAAAPGGIETATFALG